ncbi:ABC transporter permease [Acidiferrimicrobium sp. IK]|uniref:ABC transporter permease n=1 Tax=Acidiferrimicrobium sp. IK TaxID=2871700 RepID=UPI0021CB0EE3|nr:ABC transporter permease [Acidiferrimicrobium sp. IK]MCU4185833.1 ABC transporter permease [Acidiferrimicrobium sp. IK]
MTAAAPATDPRPSGEHPAEGPKGFVAAFVEAIVEGSSTTVTVLAVVAAIVIGGILIAFSDPHVLGKMGHFFSAPGAALGAAWDSASAAYSAMFRGAIVNFHTVSAASRGGSVTAVFNPISETIVNATPLIFAGLAVMLPFRAGLFNIGATGQFIGGAIVAGYLGFAVSLPPFIHVVVAVAGGFAGGAAVGWFVGFLRARTGANEVIVTIMLNYVAEYFLLYVLGTSPFRRPGRSDPITPFMHGTARLPHLAGASLRINAGILVALAAAAAVSWLLKRSTLGFEIRAVGANARAARGAGMNVERGYILVMLIAGGLAGLAAASVVLGTNYTVDPQIYGTYGIDAITIALLGRGTPLGVVLASLLYGALHAGGVTMVAATQTPIEIVTVIQSVIVLFVAAPPLVRALFRLRTPKQAEAVPLLAAPAVVTEP